MSGEHKGMWLTQEEAQRLQDRKDEFNRNHWQFPFHRDGVVDGRYTGAYGAGASPLLPAINGIAPSRLKDLLPAMPAAPVREPDKDVDDYPSAIGFNADDLATDLEFIFRREIRRRDECLAMYPHYPYLKYMRL